MLKTTPDKRSQSACAQISQASDDRRLRGMRAMIRQTSTGQGN
jgi:hypothetical protein